MHSLNCTCRFRFYLIYFTLVLHGIGTLMPWNMFITAKEVRMKKKESEFTTAAIWRKNCLKPENMQQRKRTFLRDLRQGRQRWPYKGERALIDSARHKGLSALYAFCYFQRRRMADASH